MKKAIHAFATAALLSGPAYAQGPMFEPFAALKEGKDCRIELRTSDADFCGTVVPSDQVRGWYVGDKNAHLDSGMSMLIGQKYVFTVVSNTPEGLNQQEITFLNPGTAKRFFVQLEMWSGKQSAGGANPFPHWLELGR